MTDLASLVRVRLDAVIVAMKDANVWQVVRPPDTAFVDMGAFGGRTMAFEQWLRWVFVPNVETLLATGGPWPASSSVAIPALREGDTNPAIASLVSSLSRFDALFGGSDGSGPTSEAPVPAAAQPPAVTTSRTERASEVGRAILREVMAMPEFANTGRVLTLGRAAPVLPGDVPTAWIGCTVSGRPIVYALLGDLEIFVTVEVLTKKDPVMVLRSIQVKGADVSEATRAVAEWLRGGGDSDPTAINPLDVAVMLRDALALEVPARRGFRMSVCTNHSNPDLPAMSAVDDENVGVWVTALPSGGVRIDLAPESKGAARARIEAATFARFVEIRSEIVESTRRALAARDAFFGRPFTAGAAAQSIVEALSGAPALQHLRLEHEVTRDDYLFGWPRAAVVVREASAERRFVNLEESSDGISVFIDDQEPMVVVPSLAALRIALPDLVRRATRRSKTLSADVLVEGHAYRVLRPMSVFEAGETIRFTERQYIPRESIQIYRFTSTTRPGVRAELQDSSAEDLSILQRLDAYLDRA